MLTGPYPFFELYVASAPTGGSIVYWGMDRAFNGVPPYTFTLEWAEAPDGEWETVTTVVDTYFAVDPVQRMYAKEQQSCYRVRAAYTEPCSGAAVEATSYAVQSYGTWTKRDWLIAREISRKELLLQRKYTGWSGNLLKRRIWGADCPVCADWDTDDPTFGKCTTCHGTGKLGGYWPGHAVYGYQMQAGPTKEQVSDPNVGMVENIALALRMSAYPHISTYDVFVENDTGRRFIVRKVDTVAEIRGIPLVYAVTMMLAPFTDAVYAVPITPEPVVPEVEEPAPVPVATDEFLEPVEPAEVVQTPAAEPEEEAEESVVETELIVDATPSYGIWYDRDTAQWMLGQHIGDETTAVYSTTNGTANPFFIDAYSWNTPGVSVTADTEQLVVTAPLAAASGTYIRSGTYEGTYAYLQQ